MSLEMAEALKEDIDAKQPEYEDTEETVVLDDDKTDKTVVLSDDEIESLTGFLEELISHNFKYYTEELSCKNSGSEEEQLDYLRDTAKLCAIYYSLAKHRENTLTYEETRELVLYMDFGIFDVIRDNEDVDNPLWLWRVMEVYHKLAIHSGLYSKCSL